MGKKNKWGGDDERFTREDSTVLEADDALATSMGPIVGASLTVLRGPTRRSLFNVDTRGTVLGRGFEADIRLLDPTISREHARLWFSGGSFHLADLDSTRGTRMDGRLLTGEVKLPLACRIQLGSRTELLFMSHDEKGAEEYARLSRLSGFDAQTGLGDATLLERRLAEEVAFCERRGLSVSLILLDFRSARVLADEAGDDRYWRFLGDAADRLRRAVRAEDSTFRCSDEEFAVLVRGGDPPALVELAERLRRSCGEVEQAEKNRVDPLVGIGRFEHPRQLSSEDWRGDPRTAGAFGVDLLDNARTAVRQARTQATDEIVVVQHGEVDDPCQRA